MSRTKKAFQGIFTSYISYFVLTVVQIFLSPFILSKYGQDTLGAYGSINQLLGYLTILDSSINITFNRYFAQAFGHSNRDHSLRSVFSASVIIYSAIGLISCCLAISASFFVGDAFGVSGSLEIDLRNSMLILGIVSLVKTPLGVFGTFLYASQNMMVLNFISIVNAILRGVLVFVFMYTDFGITGILLSGLLAEIVSGLMGWAYFNRSFRHILSFAKPSLKFMKELARFSRSSLIIQLTTKLRLSTDTLLVGIFISVGSASVFYSSITPPLMCFTLANLLMTNTLPGMNQIIGGGNSQEIKRVYFKLLKGVLALALIVFMGIVLLNEFVVTLWVGKDQYIGGQVNLLLGFYASLLIIGSYNGNFLISMGIIGSLAKTGLILAILGLVLSVFLVKGIGVFGLMISSLAVMLLGTVYQHYQVTKLFKTNLLFQVSA